MKQSVLRLLALISLVVATSVISFAQGSAGSMSGVVKDPNGAVVVGATVTVKNPGTGQEFTATTSDNGTFTIPAGTLQAGTVYASQIGFFRFVGSTNSSQATDAYRATYTEFSLVTAPAGPQTLILKNPVWTPSNFSFDVVCTNVPIVIIDYKFNLAAPSWLSIITNGSPGNGFHVVIPQAATNNAIFFRSRVGP